MLIEIPAVAVEILEDGDGIARLEAWLLEKADASGREQRMITREIVEIETPAILATSLMFTAPPDLNFNFD